MNPNDLNDKTLKCYDNLTETIYKKLSVLNDQEKLDCLTCLQSFVQGVSRANKPDDKTIREKKEEEDALYLLHRAICELYDHEDDNSDVLQRINLHLKLKEWTKAISIFEKQDEECRGQVPRKTYTWMYKKFEESRT
jgi:hypothetical protein